MKLTPQRAVLLIWLVSTCWVGGLVAIALAQPTSWALFAAWGAGSAALLLLALYFGLALRLEQIQLQHALRVARAPGSDVASEKQRLPRVWWPLVDSVADQAAASARDLAGQLAAWRQRCDALDAELADERSRSDQFTRRCQQAEAEGERRRSLARVALGWLRQADDAIPDAPHEWAVPGGDSGDAAGRDLREAIAAVAAAVAAAGEALRAQPASEKLPEVMPNVAGDAVVRDLEDAARQLAEVVDAFQLLSLNLRLSLAHLDAWDAPPRSLLDDVSVELEALLTGAKGIADGLHGIGQRLDAPVAASRQLAGALSAEPAATDLVRERLDQAAAAVDRLARAAPELDAAMQHQQERIAGLETAAQATRMQLDTLRERLLAARQVIQDILEP
jgi:methyl-accepting chemotaxis protein